MPGNNCKCGQKSELLYPSKPVGHEMDYSIFGLSPHFGMAMVLETAMLFDCCLVFVNVALLHVLEVAGSLLLYF